MRVACRGESPQIVAACALVVHNTVSGFDSSTAATGLCPGPAMLMLCSLVKRPGTQSGAPRLVPSNVNLPTLHRGTVAEWQLAHPDGIYPERSGFTRPPTDTSNAKRLPERAKTVPKPAQFPAENPMKIAKSVAPQHRNGVCWPSR